MSRVIPASKRPDGTVRKPVRIREGFKSEELGEVKPYKPRGRLRKEAAANHRPGMPAAPVAEEQKASKSRAQRRKRAKERKQMEAANQNQDTKTEETDKVAAQLSKMKIDHVEKTSKDPDVAKKKQIRKLEKKLRQIADLETRKAKGEDLTPEQEAKIASKVELEAELSSVQAP